MSEYSVIHSVGETLKSLIWENRDIVISDPNLLGNTDDQRISFEPPFKLFKDTEENNIFLSLYLYRIMENADMKNRRLEPQQNNSFLKYPPLFLNLFYLITPLAKEAKHNHSLLGKVMQIFHDNGIIKGSELKGVLANTNTELRLILNPISMEDITKLWSSFLRPYHLSVSYEVKVIEIDSERETGGERVRRKRIEVSQKS